METVHAAGRRSLPPVPRSSAEHAPAAAGPPVDPEVPTERFVVDLTTGEQHAVTADAASADAAELDLAQQFVARLRAAAADFAEAAGAVSAVVREAVPPARHRRARCRVVLRHADESQVDVTFLGPAGSPGRPSRHGFDRQIRRWLLAGQRRDDAWLVADPDAPDGLAVDLSAWAAAA
ncbi:hypothetical protein ACI78T_17985 [Blastococcus sp. SYSU D00922]